VSLAILSRISAKETLLSEFGKKLKTDRKSQNKGNKSDDPVVFKVFDSEGSVAFCASEGLCLSRNENHE
jgi:hypothetical protein